MRPLNIVTKLGVQTVGHALAPFALLAILLGVEEPKVVRALCARARVCVCVCVCVFVFMGMSANFVFSEFVVRTCVCVCVCIRF
jgi:hypothetical protein